MAGPNLRAGGGWAAAENALKWLYSTLTSHLRPSVQPLGIQIERHKRKLLNASSYYRLQKISVQRVGFTACGSDLENLWRKIGERLKDSRVASKVIFEN
jgi:hypothetical protein